jgi:hypothetical protein
VSTSGESQLVDEFFRGSEECAEALMEGGLLEEKCLQEENDTPETLAARLGKLDNMFNEMYVHVGKE